MKKNGISVILRSEQTVFSSKDIAMLWREAGTNTTRVRLNYYIKTGELFHIRRGLYAKDKNYSKIELATKICTPSYVSFETVLAKEGIIFQYYERIFVASYQTKDILCDGQIFSFKKIKDPVLTNQAGTENKENCSMATKERAFLDTVYLNKDYHFDNLAPLDWNKIFELLPMYGNKRMEKKVHEYFNDFKTNQ